MNQAEPTNYGTSNTLQKRGALKCLEEYARKIRWRSLDRVIDIGCGDGGVTTDILKKFLPSDFKTILGVDINEKMVQFANERYGDERTSFGVLDIAEILPRSLWESFDHAFSFYALHWIKDQERAFTNIYNALTKGGDCFLVFLGDMPVYDVFRRLSKTVKWRSFMNNVECYVSPYHDLQDPEKEVRRTMARVGFQNIDVQCKEMHFTYPSLEDLKRAVAAINPFKIPADLKEEFLEDYLQVVKDLRLIDEVNNNVPVNVKANYSLIVAYGTK